MGWCGGRSEGRDGCEEGGEEVHEVELRGEEDDFVACGL